MRPLCTQSPVHPALFALLGLATIGLAASDSAKSSTTTTATACTASSTSGAFFDLRPDAAIKAKPDGSRPSNSRGAPLTDYKARGYDYGKNFTLNICDAVVDPIEDVNGIEANKWQNISAYYDSQGEHYSLGFQSGNLITRGKELVLQYTGGSPCGKTKSKGSWKRGLHGRSAVHEGASYHDYEDEDETTSFPESTPDSASWTASKSFGGDDDDDVRRKSATIFFTCDRDIVGGNAVVSFIGVDPDECAYIFKAKSSHACASAEPHKPGSVGPGSVFAIILVIAVLVYVVGGVFYNRTVENARGWRQLPNYSLWSGLWSFISDMFVIATSSCARLLPNRRGYHHLAGSMNGRGRNSREDENRLIDQYDEEWED